MRGNLLLTSSFFSLSIHSLSEPRARYCRVYPDFFLLGSAVLRKNFRTAGDPRRKEGSVWGRVREPKKSTLSRSV